jgi:hypothetical protein
MSNDLTTIDFHGARLVAVKGATPAETLIAMKPVAEGMGLQWEKQRIKLNDHPVLGPSLRVVPFPSAGGVQDGIAIPLTKLNFWLATIQPNKIPDAQTRATVIEYQTECADALFAHFFNKATGTSVDMSAVGGMVKGIILKQVPALIEAAILERLDALIEAKLCRDPRLAAVSHVPALQVVSDHKVPQKGRGGFVRSVSRRLERFCNARGYHVPEDARGTSLFHVEAVSAWLAHEGKAMIQTYKDTLGGQQILPFKSRN